MIDHKTKRFNKILVFLFANNCWRKSQKHPVVITTNQTITTLNNDLPNIKMETVY